MYRIHAYMPERDLDSLLLPDTAKAQIQELVEEHKHAEQLEENDLFPKNCVLLVGPPGNGKTAVAQALACELEYHFFALNFGTVIEEFSGLVQRGPELKDCFSDLNDRSVLVLDAIDILSVERRYSVIRQLSALPSRILVVVTTSRPELLDKYIMRRFDMRIELPYPSFEQQKQFITDFAREHGVDVGCDPATLVTHLAPYKLSFAEIRDFCADVGRRIVLAPPGTDAKTLRAITEAKLRDWKVRWDTEASFRE